MLRVSKVKQRMKKHELVIRAFLRFPSPGAAEIMALSGVDLIVLDQEHYPFNMEEIERIVRAAQTYGAECMVRVQNTEPTRIAQVMESGVVGVVAPHIETYEEAMEVVSAVKYAPEGTRGFCPITRAAAYGMRMAPNEFAAFSNAQTTIILMTETKKGLENLDRILTIPEVDGISIGPSDVSASYGYPGQPEHPAVKSAIEEGQRKIVASGKALCTQAYNGKAAKRVYEMGSRVLTIGSDVQMLTKKFSELVGSMRQVEQEYFAKEGKQG